MNSEMAYSSSKAWIVFCMLISSQFEPLFGLPRELKPFKNSRLRLVFLNLIKHCCSLFKQYLKFKEITQYIRKI